MVERGPFLEFLSGKVTESAVNTFTEKEFATPASKTEKMAMLIHQIWMQADHPETIDATVTEVHAGLTKQSVSAKVDIDNENLIAISKVSVNAGGSEGTLSEYFHRAESFMQKIFYFDPPLLYAKEKVYAFVDGNNNAGAAKSLQFKIGYSLQKVTESEFIAALVP